jgi:tetratricopeptide (TPR) repeat protein
MIRLNGRALALLAMMALPSAALAQKEPAETKETKEAQKSLGLAMLQQTPEKKKPHLEAAMRQLQIAMTKNPENGRVWLMAGQVYSGLGDLVGADSAFTKAEALYPGYAEDIAGEREVAWVEAFNAGIAAMDQKNNDEAIAKMELAEKLYPHRPEAKMNLGALYAQKNEADKAVAIFEKAIASTNGPLKDKLKPEDAAMWKRYSDMAKANIAQIVGSKGVEHYQADRFEEAAAAFAKASEINPHSRDYLYNMAQSHYARATKISEARAALIAQRDTMLKAKPPKTAEAAAKLAEANKLGQEVAPAYDQIVKMFERVLAIEPANPSLYLLIAHSYKLQADAMTDSAQSNAIRNKALSFAQQADTLGFEVADLMAQSSEGQATITGTVKTMRAAPGSPIKIKVTLLSLEGATVGTQEITIAAPAKDATAPIDAKAAITGEVAGWRYEVVK